MDTPESLLTQLEHGMDREEYIARLKRVQLPKDLQFLLVRPAEPCDPTELQNIKNQIETALASNPLGSVVLNFPLEMVLVKVGEIETVRVESKDV